METQIACWFCRKVVVTPILKVSFIMEGWNDGVCEKL